jgi:hypothetical protein
MRTSLGFAVENEIQNPVLGDELLGIARSMYYPDRSYAAMVKNSVGQVASYMWYIFIYMSKTYLFVYIRTGLKGYDPILYYNPVKRFD